MYVCFEEERLRDKYLNIPLIQNQNTSSGFHSDSECRRLTARSFLSFLFYFLSVQCWQTVGLLNIGKSNWHRDKNKFLTHSSSLGL